MIDSISYLDFNNWCRVKLGKICQMGQSGSQKYVNIGFSMLQTTGGGTLPDEIIILVAKVKNNVPIILSYSRCWPAIQNGVRNKSTLQCQENITNKSNVEEGD